MPYYLSPNNNWNTNWKNDRKDADNAWDALAGDLTFAFNSSEIQWESCSSPNPARNVIERDVVGGSDPLTTAAITVMCVSGGDPVKFHIVFDSAKKWTAANDTGSFVLNSRGVATHEFGHAAGMLFNGYGTNGHFFDEGACPGTNDDPDYPNFNTMCFGFAGNPLEWNSGASRYSLESHDIHEFNEVY